MPDEIRQHDEQFAESLAGQLHSHFDTVMVFVTRQEPDGTTVSFATGRGNWYARYGQVSKWLSDSNRLDEADLITDLDDDSELDDVDPDRD